MLKKELQMKVNCLETRLKQINARLVENNKDSFNLMKTEAELATALTASKKELDETRVKLLVYKTKYETVSELFLTAIKPQGVVKDA